ncbi:MAG: glycosyltransferase family 2 protein [Acidobacteria bacterium]|nr:glycosyltransferase family 2 protein [Acidobacteriota bacterium]
MKLTKSSTSDKHRPAFSVIVPVYNASPELRLCLAALQQSAYEDFEVIVVDDGSSEALESIVAPYQCRYVKLDRQQGPARARNRGAALAKGRYLVFIDADVCVHQDTLERFAGAFAARPDVVAVLGSYDEAPAHTNFFSQYKNLFHHYVHQGGAGESRTFWSGCGAMRRDIFLSFGGFDAARYRRPAIEDIELGTWIKEAGYQVILDRRIQAQHLKRWTFWSLLKSDIFDRGIPWIRLMWRVGASANTLNVVPSQRWSVLLVYLTALLLPLATVWHFAGAIAALSALGVGVLNRHFYGYFLQRRGVWFTLRVLPVHGLYFCYCGIAVVIGTWLYFLTDRPKRPTTVIKNCDTK